MVAKAPDALSQPDDEQQETFRSIGVDLMFAHIKASLHEFGTDFDVFTHEDSMHTSGRVDQAIAKLRETGNIYEKDGATWLRTTEFGDDKDRVVIKSDGNPAYIAGDLAYFLDKRQRGFDLCIYMLGADHHGYIARLKAAAAALGDDPDTVEVLIGQMVNLVRDGQPVRMSKRAGTVITLDDLVDAIGVDAARYVLIRVSVDTPIDIDLALWSSASSENPVYYVQYAHARLSALARSAAELGHRADTAHLDLLTHDREGTLMRSLGEFPRVLKTAAVASGTAPGMPLPRGSRRRLPPLLRLVPRAAAGRRAAQRPARCPAGAVRGDAPGHRQRTGDPRRQRPGADVNAHPAGPRHADEIHHGGAPARPQSAAEMLTLAPNVWPRNAARGADGEVAIAGVPVTQLAEEYGTPLFVIDEDDFRSRCRDIAAAFGGGEHVRYAAKAFLCSEVARWIDQEGLSLDVASGGELAVALHADFPPERIALHGNNKSVAELAAAVKAGVDHVVLDSMTEIERLDAIAGDAGVVQDVLVRVTVGVEAHTHEFISTAHEDQKFGLSLASGAAMDAVRRVFATDHLRLVGLHSHIGSQIFDVAGFELAAHRVIGLLRDVVAEFGVEKTAQIVYRRPRRWTRYFLSAAGRSAADGRAGRQAQRHRAQRVGRRGPAGAETGGRARSGHRRARHHHALRGGHRQGRGGQLRPRTAAMSASTAA